MTKVVVFVGSLRKESMNRKLAEALGKLGKPKLELEIFDLSDVPMFNQDHEKDPPAPVKRLHQAVKAADGVLFVTPEYNRGAPAVLKNAIDWGSRPYGNSVWPGKRGGLIGTSPGAVGTAVAQSQLRSTLMILSVELMPQPEIYLVFKPGLIDEAGEVSDSGTRDFLKSYADKLAAWIGKSVN